MSFISIGEYQASVNDGKPINEHCVPEQTESPQMCSKAISAVFTDPQAGRAYFKRAVQPICEVHRAKCAVQPTHMCSPKIIRRGSLDCTMHIFKGLMCN